MAFFSSNPAELLFFLHAFTLAEPHADAGSDQRTWKKSEVLNYTVKVTIL